jgi:hypothetical protein
VVSARISFGLKSDPTQSCLAASATLALRVGIKVQLEFPKVDRIPVAPVLFDESNQ